MPLNRLENFIKNIEGRILYVNPNDLDSTDNIENEGNSLAQPFKTIQRALIEAARFSYIRGNNNDIIEKTTILVYPGEHVIDNRPGYYIYPNAGNPTQADVRSPDGTINTAQSVLNLNLTTNFDINQENNILYKFNSIHGGVIVPRGTSIVGLDLRKTKIRPKYVPHPIDPEVPDSAIFRITGACYFWQFTIFDGKENQLVYTNPASFEGDNDVSTPTFSHHKLTCFEYADGVNNVIGYDKTDLQMYYAKLSNAFNISTGSRDIPDLDKYPENTDGFAPRRPEYEIVGAFATDPINISDIKSGDGNTPSRTITVTTSIEHGLNTGTPIKVDNVIYQTKTDLLYNISTTVQSVISKTEFTYLIPEIPSDFPASVTLYPGLSVANATVTIETDNVSGASPYIFNCSLRSVYGMNGMKADGNKATGFKSMVVAQFTGISLQKDDRAFVKYDKPSRTYKGLPLEEIPYGSELASQSSSLDADKVYHLNSDAIYRTGWETTHIRMTNDAIMQIVSVFAIGYNRHFSTESGGDASITNANSNFGQISLNSDGFKNKAFTKDNAAYITNIITPKANESSEFDIDCYKLSVGVTTSTIGISSHLYLSGYTNKNDKPPVLIQGYRPGSKVSDTLYLSNTKGLNIVSATIQMVDSFVGNVAVGSSTSKKTYGSTIPDSNSIFTIGSHKLTTGEKVRILSHSADLPENIEENTVYYAITDGANSIRTDSITLTANQIQLASSLTDAENGSPITVYKGSNLYFESRVNDKDSGDYGHPIQFDDTNSQWYIHTNPLSGIYNALVADPNDYKDEDETDTELPTFIKRTEDARSLDDKLYKFRVVIPKEISNGKNPEEGFIIQESSSTGARQDTDFTATTLSINDYAFDRNPRFISTCSEAASTVTAVTDIPHDLKVNEKIVIKNVKSTTNTIGAGNSGFNGTFLVNGITNSTTFTYSTEDIDGNDHSVGNFTSDINTRTTDLPRFERNDLLSNFYIYRNDTITPYIQGIQDGIYHLYVLNGSNQVPVTNGQFGNLKYSQNVVDLYPQLDRDNINDNPPASVSSAKLSPLGDVVSNELSKSITRETADKLIKDFGVGLRIDAVSSTSTAATLTFDREHNYGGVVDGTLTVAGSSYTPGSGIATYHNVKMLYDSTDPTPGSSTWTGVTANVTIENGSVKAGGIKIVDSGSAGATGVLYLDQTKIPTSGTDAQFTISTSGISTNIGDIVQTTGLGTESDGYYHISAIPTTKQITLTKGSNDPAPKVGQYAFDISPLASILSTSYNATTKITTFTTNSNTPHGLVVGRKFRVASNDNNNLGDFIVTTLDSSNPTTKFTAVTNAELSNPSLIYKLGFASNSNNSDSENENLASRGLTFYGRETLSLGQAITSQTAFKVSVPSSGIGTVSRFPLGTYIQIDDEIMRVVSSTLSGSANDEITVIRGSMGSDKASHANGSVITKIKPLPIEFRRPSILRASGHTFEYLGFGPGNYSTGLPQVQVRTLSEREEFLSQSQERSCGAVVYTGMNSKGDFFIGNKAINSATGKEKTFDAPIPSIAGEDPARLSVIFDEVIAKERILVEGGKTNKILSQFDGPVKFTGDITCQNITINGTARFRGDIDFDKDVNFRGDTTYKNDIKLEDEVKFIVGDDDDLEIHHTSAVSYIKNTTATPLKIQNDSNIEISKTNGNAYVKGVGDATTLHYGGNEKLATTNLGVNITGTTTDDGATHAGNVSITSGTLSVSGKTTATGGVYIPDDTKLTFGNSTTPDLEILHNATLGHNYIRDIGTGDLKIQGSAAVAIEDLSGNDSAVFFTSAGVNLYWNGGTDPGVRVSTTTTGVTVGTNQNNGNLLCHGDVTAYTTSDINLKDNIVPIPDALNKVISISGNTFTWKEGHPVNSGDDTGVIAQEIEKIGLPGVVTTRDNGQKAVRYERLVPLLIEAIKELKNEVDELKRGK